MTKEGLTKKEFVIETANAHGMTRSGRCYIPKKLDKRGNKKYHHKIPIIEAKDEEFWRNMQPKEYSVVKHLEKMPTKISVWALLMSLEQHRHALLKDLNETHVLVGTNNDNLVAMVSRVISRHRVSFSEEELPCEGVIHYRALHITINCEEMILNRVLIDDGFGLNILSLSTLKKLNFDLGKIRQNQVIVNAFCYDLQVYTRS